MNAAPGSSLGGCDKALSELRGEGRGIVVMECGGSRPDGAGFSAKYAALRAAGLALGGRRVFLRSLGGASYAADSYEQIRSAVCVPNLNVVFSSAHGGEAQSRAGAAFQMDEDVALMRLLPGMAVIDPSDSRSAYMLTRVLMTSREGPACIRLSQCAAGEIYDPGDSDFIVGGARILREGDGVTICASGAMVREALVAAESLAVQGIAPDVIDCYSVKPFPESALLASVRRTGCCVVAARHTRAGGLYGAVAECLCRGYPAPTRCVSMDDRFGQSGSEDDLREYYGLTHREIEHCALQVWAIRRR
jgi:transketolase